MISVPSLRQPLSGNSIRNLIPALIGLGMLLLFSSCELFKPISQNDGQDPKKEKEELDPIQGRRVYDPTTGTYVLVKNAPTGPMDTIVWKEIPTTVEPPIYSTSAPVGPGPGSGSNPVNPIGVGEGNSQLLSSYNVSVVLPFLSDRYNSIDRRIAPNSTWALQFYNGMEMAFDELSEQGVALNVNVVDSKASEQHVQNLVRTDRDLSQAHLVIGPYLRNNASILANQVRTTGGVLVSPHSASSNVSSQNPNYVQVKPTLISHCQAIMRHVLSNHTADQVVLVSMDTEAETARFEYFQREYERLNGLQQTEPLRRLAIDTNRLDMQTTSLKEWFSYDKETVFIVPSWAKESFIYNFLRKLDLERTQYQRVKVYGMPQWMDYERIDFDFYEKLNVHVSSSVFINDLDPDIRAFKRRYYERYGEIPLEEAYVGYDATRYFGKMLNSYGTKFQLQLEQNPEQLLHTEFDFQRVIVPTTTGIEFPQVERWENKFVNILKFENYRFVRAN